MYRPGAVRANDEMAVWVHEVVGATDQDKRLDRLVEAVTKTSNIL